MPKRLLSLSSITSNYMVEHVGEDGVGLGSDFDGAKMPSGLRSAAGLQNLVGAMRARGFDQPLIEKVRFKNWLRVLGQTWRETGQTRRFQRMRRYARRDEAARVGSAPGPSS